MATRPIPDRRLALALLLALGCGCDDGATDASPDGASMAEPEPTPDAAAEPDPEPEPDPDASPPPDVEPWPDPLPDAMPGLAAVHRGQLVGSGERLTISGPPAGLDHPVPIELTLVWRGVEPIEWPDDPAAWLEAPGFDWIGPPPRALAPDDTARIALSFDPRIAAEAGTHEATLTAPGADFRLTLAVELRRPLRLLVVGSDGRALASDAYGFDPYPVADPMPSTARHGVTWGAGRFFRHWATGGEWQDPGAYAYSDDGLSWTASTAAPEFWASGCAHGIDRFACAVGDRFAWSMNGAGVVHEATRWQGMLHALHFADDRFVAVGRGGRRAVSFDGITWAHDSGDGGLPDGVDDTWFFGITARPEGDWVAVGGQNSTLTAHSPDGIEWTVAREPGTRGASSVACLPGRCLRDGNGAESPLYVSDDGIGWRPLELPEPRPYHLLGTVDGRFVAAVNPWRQPGELYLSPDGVEWSRVHAAEDEVHWVGMAVEGWEPDR